MYVAYTAAHWPMHALEKDIAKYRGKFDTGFEPERRARFDRMKQLGLLDAKAELSACAEDWQTTEHKEWNARCMEVYAAMIDCMDQGIGRIIGQLKKDGRFDNTLIFFLQDNGGCAELMGRDANKPGSPTPLKPLGPNGLQPKVWPPMQTRDGRWVRSGPDAMPGPENTYVAYGRGWANVSNTPFREYKHWVHEGGISTPLIMHWQAGLSPSRAGRLERQPGHIVDIMATCVDVSGSKYPSEFGGQKIKSMDGVSLLPALKGKALGRKQPLFWEHEGNRAVRDGKWKLVAKENQPWELYDMEMDRSELHDLAAQNLKKVKELSIKWQTWAARSDVLPLGAWKAKPVTANKSE
jgi:arylsulfatase